MADQTSVLRRMFISPFERTSSLKLQYDGDYEEVCKVFLLERIKRGGGLTLFSDTGDTKDFSEYDFDFMLILSISVLS